MIRAGVIGLGVMGRNHARVYSEMKDVQLVGVADMDYAVAQNIAARYNTAPFPDYRQLLEKKLDIVSVVVPTSFHKEVAIEVARAGSHLLVEKPLADSCTAAKEIIEAAEREGVKLMVGHIERFNPVVPIVKACIAGEEVSLIEITRIGPYPPRIKDVGVMTDLAVHDIDLIRYLTESEIREVHALTSNTLCEHEDTGILICSMECGTLARLTVSWLTPYKVREITIATTKKFIRASLIDQKVSEYTPNGSANTYVVRDIPVSYGEPLRLELEAFVHSVRYNIQPPVTGDDGLKALEIATQNLNRKVCV